MKEAPVLKIEVMFVPAPGVDKGYSSAFSLFSP